ncbi:NeuD/PglB/VioB family sugar acetyltransferase [Rubricoccus marinus]|uniref:Transferase n=1 Tax=Rubricoccus marinus TaxID=716817 RepID=A0A259U0P1_9BACT|nr:NeuD/PglB/VioB family sugar acetyltransferase [Rubricoccus marinus]OZC03408.1 transferase [Rubricoccus marinus]
MSVLVVGAGGHAKVVIATLRASGAEIAGMLDDAPEASPVLGVPVVGRTEVLSSHAGQAVIAIGSNRVRQRIAGEYPSVAWATVVHPAAVVHESVALGPGTVVFAGAVLQPDTVVGRHAIINTSATVDHDGDIGDFVHVAPGCNLSGGVTLGEGVFLGVGGAALPGATVGAWTVVGAGGVVVRDLPANVTAVGIPARPLARP